MDPEMQDLVPVDDPELIAILEQPQAAINKGTGGNGGGAPLPAWAAKPFEDQIAIYSGLAGAANTFQDDFAGNTITGGLENTVQGMTGLGTPGQRDWWASFRQSDNVIRNQLFGATLTPSEQAAYAATSINERMESSEVRRNLQTRRDIVRKALARKTAFLRAQGYNEDAISALAGEYAGDFSPEAPGGEDGADRGDPNAAAPIPAGTDLEASPDGSSQFATQRDADYTAAAQQLFDQGASRADMDALAVSWGYGRWGEELDRAEAARSQGARVQLEPPVTGYKGPSVVGSLAATPVGSFFGGAANALTGGTLDELGGMLGGDQQQIQTAKEVMREANPVSSFLGETTGAALAMTGINRLPGMAAKAGLVGDVAYGTAYGAGENNENRLGGAIVGGGAAAAGNYLGGKLVDKLTARAARPPQPRQSAQRMQQAEQFGIELPMGAAGGRGSSLIEKGLDILPGSASVMEAGRETLRGQVSEGVEAVADNYGTANNFASAGEALQAGAKKWISRFEEVASKAYDAIPISPKAPTTFDNTLGALQDLNGRFSSNPKLAEAMQNSRLSRYLDALGGKDSALSWEDMKQFRSRIGEEIGDARFSDGTMTSDLRKLYGALSEDMRASAAAQGPQALRRFDRANDLYRQGQERIEGSLKSILGDDGKMAPEKAAAVIDRIAKANKGSSDLKKLAEVRASIPAEEWGEVSGTLIRLAGQPRNSAGREFNPATFVQTFQDMSEPAKNLLFGGANKEMRQSLEEFSSVIGNLAENNALRNNSVTAGVANAGAAISLLPVVLFSPTVAAGLAGQAITSYGLSRLWTNPRFVKWATGYAKMQRGAQRAGGQPNHQKQIELLGKVARAEPVIAAEALGLQQQLAAAFGGNVKLAAGEGDQTLGGAERE